MSKTSSKNTTHRAYAIFLPIATGLLASTLATGPLLARQPVPKTTPAPRLGEFNLRSFESVQSDYNSKTGANVLLLEKPDLISPRYDFSAVSMRLTVQKGRAQTGAASGNVRVTVRDKAIDGTNKQTLSAACNEARYRAGKNANEGHIDLTGDIVLKVYNSGLAEPFVLTGQSGTIDLLGANESRYRITKGSATVTPIEPASAPAKK